MKIRITILRISFLDFKDFENISKDFFLSRNVSNPENAILKMKIFTSSFQYENYL